MRRKECQNMYLHIYIMRGDCVRNGRNMNEIRAGIISYGKGDIGFVFSDIIHHYQAFSEKNEPSGLYLGSVFFLVGKYLKIKYKGMLLNIRLFVQGRLNQMFIMQFRRLSKWKKTNL